MMKIVKIHPWDEGVKSYVVIHNLMRYDHYDAPTCADSFILLMLLGLTMARIRHSHRLRITMKNVYGTVRFHDN